MAVGLGSSLLQSPTLEAALYVPMERCKALNAGSLISQFSARDSSRGNVGRRRASGRGYTREIHNPSLSVSRQKKRGSAEGLVVRSQIMVSDWHFEDEFNVNSRSVHGTCGRGSKLGVVGESACNAVGNALSSMVEMIKVLQSYAFQMDSLLSDRHTPTMIASVQQEMATAFAWLFQQVFACTPVLMVATMILFADFAVHSVSEHVTPISSPIWGFTSPGPERFKEVELQEYLHVSDAYKSENNSVPLRSTRHEEDINEPPVDLLDMDGCGGRGSSQVCAGAGSDEGNANNGRHGWIHGTAFLRESDTTGRSRLAQEYGYSKSTISRYSLDNQFPLVQDDLVEDASAAEREGVGSRGSHVEGGWSGSGEGSSLDEDRRERLQNPVAQLSEDNGVDALSLEFDRTEEHYESMLRREPSNALLLANYAHFRHVVRHDTSGAEDLFLRAVAADSTDGHILDKFASFLWLERKNKAAAESAFKAAIACDPSNPYYTASYAHFLWHAGED